MTNRKKKTTKDRAWILQLCDEMRLRPATNTTPIPAEMKDADPGEPTNTDRAAGALQTLDYFARVSGEHWDHVKPEQRAEIQQQNMQDLFSDLAHLADRLGVDMADAYRDARRRYMEETNGTGQQFNQHWQDRPDFVPCSECGTDVDREKAGTPVLCDYCHPSADGDAAADELCECGRDPEDCATAAGHALHMDRDEGNRQVTCEKCGKKIQRADAIEDDPGPMHLYCSDACQRRH